MDKVKTRRSVGGGGGRVLVGRREPFRVESCAGALTVAGRGGGIAAATHVPWEAVLAARGRVGTVLPAGAAIAVVHTP